jgi:hypothetical protein
VCFGRGSTAISFKFAAQDHPEFVSESCRAFRIPAVAFVTRQVTISRLARRPEFADTPCYVGHCFECQDSVTQLLACCLLLTLSTFYGQPLRRLPKIRRLSQIGSVPIPPVHYLDGRLNHILLLSPDRVIRLASTDVVN